jgi:hypothetical protein
MWELKNLLEETGTEGTWMALTLPPSGDTRRKQIIRSTEGDIIINTNIDINTKTSQKNFKTDKSPKETPLLSNR